MVSWNLFMGALLFATTHAFLLHPGHIRQLRLSTAMLRMSFGNAEVNQEYLNEIALVGFMSKEEGIAEESIFRNIHEAKMVKMLRCVSDDLHFARRRLVNPKTVYSGLVDNIRFVESSLTDLSQIEKASNGVDGFLGFNIPMTRLSEYITMVQRLNVKRAVLAVNVLGNETDNGITDSTITSLTTTFSIGINDNNNAFDLSRTNFTIIKYGYYESNQEESQRPFRIVTSVTSSAIPTKATLSCLLPQSCTNAAVSAARNFPPLASGDLLRILIECIDLPKTFQKVYGVGPGNALDQETLVWMKAKGITVRERIAVLLSDFQETSEKRLHEMNEECKMNKSSMELAKSI